jgi:ABC-type transport system involved in multi-copper enzyme maturation permease subunit
MMPAILWKEYREHRMVWTALAFLGAATVLSLSYMMGAGWLGRPSETRINLCALAVMLVGAYALICGAMMLAGERENGTLPYLDALPGFRRRLWQGKLLAGVLLILGQIVLLMSLCAASSLFGSWPDAAWTLAGMFVAGLYGLSWGMLFSSFGRSVMSAILLSLAGQAAVFLLTGMLAGVVFGLVSGIYGAGPDRNPGTLWAVFFVLAAPVALVGSALVFTRLDRGRLWTVPESMRVQRRTLHPTWPMLYWLTWRQARGFAAGLAAFALLLGFITLLQGVMLWPVATLIVGVLCGATAFADEQSGAFRFLGDQRLPLGRLWVVKVGVRFGIAVVAALLVLAPSFVATLADGPNSEYYRSPEGYFFFARVFHSRLLMGLCPSGLFLTLWLVYGFVAGCLFGLLFRRGLAAGVFALFVSSLTAILWIPSLLSGGLHAWQVFGPPVLVLIAARLLMRPWAANRIASWATAVRLTPFVILAGLWIAGGPWYRVLEIPYVTPKMDLDAFRASLPTPELDEGGRLFRSACLRFDDQRHTLESQLLPQGGAPGAMGGAMAPGPPGMTPPAGAGGVPGMPAPAPMPGAPAMMPRARGDEVPGGAGLAPMPNAAGGQPPALPPMERARNASQHGWPADDKDLAAWLDKLYAGEWLAVLKKAADLPTGPFDDVRNMTWLTSLPANQPAQEIAVVLVARGLQRQAAGDDAAYVENLRIGLALSRSMRDRTPAVDLLVGREVEGVLVGGLDRWLEKLHGRPDLIRQALAVLSRHLDETASEGNDQEAIAALILKNTLDYPLSLQEQDLSFAGYQPRQNGPGVSGEALGVAVAMAWLVPWEHARQERVFRVMIAGDRQQQEWLIDRRNDLGPLPGFAPAEDFIKNRDTMRIILAEPWRLCSTRAMQLKLALRWYQADNGKAADNLDELVPKYLPSIPLDPYDDESFRYRLSRGEEIGWPADTVAPAMTPTLPMGGQPPAAPAPPTRKIPPGQGILWSVGENKVDNGGHRQSSSFNGQTAFGEDVIFLVPLPPKAK